MSGLTNLSPSHGRCLVVFTYLVLFWPQVIRPLWLVLVLQFQSPVSAVAVAAVTAAAIFIVNVAVTVVDFSIAFHIR